MPTSDLVAITRKYIDSHTVAIGASSTFWENDATSIVHVTPRPPMAVLMQFRKSEPPKWVSAARSQIESAFPKLDWILGGANSETPLTNKWVTFHGYPEDAVRLYLDEKLSIARHYVPYNIQTATNTYMDGLGIRPSEVLGIEWGRGCQFRCGFCRYHMNGKKKGTYLRDPEIVKQDMLLNYERYGTTRYNYLDDTTNESYEKVVDMANVAQSLPFEVEWVGYGRLDLVGSNRHTIKILRDSGLRSMFFGIETFNKEASKMIGKGWNGVHGKEFMLELKDIWANEINFHTSFIVGLTPETSEELHSTLQWCIDNNFYSWRFIPLTISSEKILNVSEFDKDCGKYGYNFPDTGRTGYWVNEHWNYESALEKSKELNMASASYMQPVAFSLGAVANITNQTMKQVMATQKHDIRLYERLADAVIAEYVSYQLNLPDK